MVIDLVIECGRVLACPGFRDGFAIALVTAFGRIRSRGSLSRKYRLDVQNIGQTYRAQDIDDGGYKHS